MNFIQTETYKCYLCQSYSRCNLCQYLFYAVEKKQLFATLFATLKEVNMIDLF